MFSKKNFLKKNSRNKTPPKKQKKKPNKPNKSWSYRGRKLFQ